jgi:hypothetical protein
MAKMESWASKNPASPAAEDASTTKTASMGLRGAHGAGPGGTVVGVTVVGACADVVMDEVAGVAEVA